MDRDELQYWVALGRVPQIGRARFALLEGHFGSMEDAWRASAAELQAAGLTGAALSALLAARDRIEPEAELEALDRLGVRALTWHDDSYPHRLKEIYDRPPLLYMRGQLTSGDEWAVALVGTRRATVYGRQAAEETLAPISQYCYSGEAALRRVLQLKEQIRGTANSNAGELLEEIFDLVELGLQAPA